MVRVVSGVGKSAETPVLVRVEALEEEEDTDLVTGEIVLAEEKLEVLPEEDVVVDDATEQEQAWLLPLQFVPDAHEVVAELIEAETVEELVADEGEASGMATSTPIGDERFLYLDSCYTVGAFVGDKEEKLSKWISGLDPG
ncbi:hypothetical protein OC861_006566 [Tilletia horrida]|nr:hypothetical protein OC861_006566 [Tilletia horrida]